MEGSNLKTRKLSTISIQMIEQMYKSYENYSCSVYKCHQAKITLMVCAYLNTEFYIFLHH